MKSVVHGSMYISRTFGSEKQCAKTDVINSPLPLSKASADIFDLAAVLASFAFFAAFAASVVAATISA